MSFRYLVYHRYIFVSIYCVLRCFAGETKWRVESAILSLD